MGRRQDWNSASKTVKAPGKIIAALAAAIGIWVFPAGSAEPSPSAASSGKASESGRPIATGPATPPKPPMASGKATASREAPPAAWLGISFADVPLPEVPKEYAHSSPEGAVRILQVFKSTSADQAGLKEGDYLLAINGIPLAGRKTLLDTIRSKGVGDLVELRIGRNGKAFLQKMALSPKPEDMRSLTRMLVGSPAPELEGKYYSGDLGPVSKNQGKVLVLDFWATWCGPCRATIPALDALHKQYKAQGVEVIGISSESLQDLKAFQGTGGQSYSLFNDVGQITTRKYQAFAYPTLVLIDRKGVVQRVEVGAHPAADMEKWIRELL